jgi:hypothetical protein
MFKTAFSDNTMGKTVYFSGFLKRNIGKLQFKILITQTITPQGAQKKHGESLQNHQQRLKKYHFRDLWQVSALACNTPANSKGGPEYVADLSEVCASAAY